MPYADPLFPLSRRRGRDEIAENHCWPAITTEATAGEARPAAAWAGVVPLPGEPEPICLGASSSVIAGKVGLQPIELGQFFEHRDTKRHVIRHGMFCVRLTNWDVEELAGMVKPGVVVEFVD